MANVEIRESMDRGGFHQNTNRNILNPLASLQKQHADYHTKTNRNKSKQTLRMEKLAKEMIEKNGITVTRSKYSDEIFSEARECLSKVSLDMGMNSEVFRPNNKGSSGTAISETTLIDLMAPLNQVTNKKQRTY